MTLQPCKCTKPAIQTMDYDKVSPANWDKPEPRINRVCSKCWSHWFGPPAAVKFFTKSEWKLQVLREENGASQANPGKP